MKERLYWILLAVFAFFGLIMGGVFLYVRSDAGTDRIRRWAAREMEAATGLDVSFSEIDYDIIPPRLRVREISVKDRKEEIQVNLEEVEISPQILPLFIGDMKLAEIYMRKPRVRLLIDPDAIQGKDKTGDFDLKGLSDIEVITVTEGGIEISTPAGQDWSAALDNISLDITSESEGLTEVRALVMGGFIRWKDHQEPVDRMELRAGVGSKGIAVRRFVLNSKDADLIVRGGTVPLDTTLPEGLNFEEVSVSVPMSRFETYPELLPSAEGIFEFTGEAGYHDGPTARGELRLRKAAVDEFRIGDLDALISLTPAGITFAEASISSDFGRLDLMGSIDFDDSLKTEMKARLADVELARLLDHLTVDSSKVLIMMNGFINLSGTINPLKLEGTIDLKNRDFFVRNESYLAEKADIILQIPRTAVKGGLRITDKAVSLSKAKVNLSTTVLDVNASFNYNNTWWLKARTGIFNLDDLGHLAGFGISGSGPLFCHIHGLYDNPVIEGEIDMNRFVFEGYRFGRVKAGVWFKEDSLVFRHLDVFRNRSRYAFEEAKFKFGGPEELEIYTKARLDNLEFPDVFATFNVLGSELEEILGVLSGSVVLNYRQNPEHFVVDVDLVHSDLSIYGERFGGGTIKGSYSDGQLVVEELLIAKGDGIISLTGKRDSDDSLDFLLVGESIDLKSFDYPFISDADASARLQLLMHVRGTSRNPAGEARLRLGPLIHSGREFGPSDVLGIIEGRRINLSGEILGGGGVIKPGGFSGENISIDRGSWVDFRDGSWNLEAVVNGLELAGVLGLEDVRDKPPTSVKWWGDLHLADGPLASATLGSCLEPYGSRSRGILGCIDVSRVDATMAGYHVQNYENIHLGLLGDRIETRRAAFTGPGVSFAIRGGADFEGPRRLRARFLMDMKLLMPFLDWAGAVGGWFEADVNMYGTWEKPAFLGEGSISGGYLSIPEVPHRISSVSGKVKFGRNRIGVRDFKARFAEGEISLDGEMLLTGFEPTAYNFNLSGSGMHLKPVQYLSLVTDAKLELRSQSDPDKLPVVTGHMNVSRLRFTQPVKLLRTITELARFRKRTVKDAFDPEDDMFEYDIRLHGRKDLVARNKLFRAEIEIDDVERPLRLVGTNQYAGLLGRITAYEGELRWYGTTFELMRGVIEFEDRMRMDNPWFDVAAYTQKRDWRVTLQAQGTLDDYKIMLSSSPALAEEDIAFLLTMGMTRGEAEQVGGYFALDPLTESFELEEGLKEYFPIIDDVRVSSEYSERTGQVGPRVGVSKEITTDLSLSASSGLGEQKDFRTELELKLSDSLSLDALYSQDDYSPFGDIGLELKLHYEF